MRESQHCNGEIFSKHYLHQNAATAATNSQKRGGGNGMVASEMQGTEFNIGACSKLITNRRIMKCVSHKLKESTAPNVVREKIKH